jgi:Family of unknown function (DUF6502)
MARTRTPNRPVVSAAPNTAGVLTAAEQVLRPLVRLLLQRGIGFIPFAEAAKALFVKVAVKDFPPHGARETDSRISVLTGIYRRDVKRLRESSSPGVRRSSDREPQSTSLSSMVLATWMGKRPYTDTNGRPLSLARTRREGGVRSFEALVASVSRDVRPRALLDEWLRRGAVTLDDENRVCLNVDAFIAQRSLDEKAFFLGHNLHDHLAAAAHNVAGGQPPFLERCVYYGRLTPESIRELESLAQEHAMRALQEVNRRAMVLQARDAGRADAQQRMTFGVYFYNAPVDDGEAKEG